MLTTTSFVKKESYQTVADPEANLGGFSRGPKGREGEGTGWVSPPLGWGSGGLPRENFGKMKQNGAIWSDIKHFKLTKTELYL